MLLKIPLREGEPLLDVSFGAVSTRPHELRAWRVQVYVKNCHLYQEDYAVILCAFASNRDAHRGLKALLDAGLDTLEKLIERRDDLQRIMCEALPW